MTTGHGETAKRQLISHLLYMDDLKLYGRNSDQLDGLLHTVHIFSDDIQMKLELDKTTPFPASVYNYDKGFAVTCFVNFKNSICIAFYERFCILGKEECVCMEDYNCYTLVFNTLFT